MVRLPALAGALLPCGPDLAGSPVDAEGWPIGATVPDGNEGHALRDEKGGGDSAGDVAGLLIQWKRSDTQSLVFLKGWGWLVVEAKGRLIPLSDMMVIAWESDNTQALYHKL